MFISVFDIFKVGIGPSSSHTMGPMVAAMNFLGKLRDVPRSQFNVMKDVKRFRASLHGSLAFTGVGHHTDKATILGLLGHELKTYDRVAADTDLAALVQTKTITTLPDNLPKNVAFDPIRDLIFDYDQQLGGHPNGMKLFALGEDDRVLLEETYYSIGGGFVVTEQELAESHATGRGEGTGGEAETPYPFSSSAEMVDMSRRSGKTIAEMKLANELALSGGGDAEAVEERIHDIWRVMDECIYRGLHSDGILPGGLKVKRRAMKIHQALKEEERIGKASPYASNEWLGTYAMAVNEENACGGQVVTAPTNGAAGVVPATLKYYLEHIPDSGYDKIMEYFLTASAIGGIIKHNASISGAECGCQAEIGSASAMAAAGLCAVLGGSTLQIENSAEIALEHHLGLTCDPVHGLVQVPCIERNGVAAVKAVSAASLALRGDGTHVIPLDACIQTMKETGEDMNSKYKETSLGGLAVNVPNC